MRVITADEIDRVLTYPALIEALREGFRADITVPIRHHHPIPQPGAEAMLLLMPAWTSGEGSFLGTKIVTVFPDNGKLSKAAVLGSYILMSGETGEPLAIIDGTSLTRWRTACASALAASYLAREDASHLVMVGAGALAPYLVRAHAAVRPIKRVTIWNRTRGNAVKAAFAIALGGIEPEIAEDLEAAVREADIVSCATLATTPLVRGKWLRQGAHLDLVGGFTPRMREADDDAVKRARVYVDTRAGATKEAGDITQPLKKGVLKKNGLRGDLFELTRGKTKGRTKATVITLFKSVGTALEDLVAAMLVWRSLA
ncbi:MAG TPA: ornithine cyclodeaminase family protein [Xanthobacteraceae bacterium]|nr:ornithine cyclodeaminase family protein [Xanthobacteraceae bacterium]